MPITSTCCRVASLSIAGVPPFNGFFSKLAILMAVVSAGHYWLGATTVFVSFMTLCSFIKVQRYALHGEVPPTMEKVREAPVFMCLGMLFLTLICCVGGLGVLFYGPMLLKPAETVLMESPTTYAEKALKSHEAQAVRSVIVSEPSAPTETLGKVAVTSAGIPQQGGPPQ